MDKWYIDDYEIPNIRQNTIDENGNEVRNIILWGEDSHGNITTCSKADKEKIVKCVNMHEKLMRFVRNEFDNIECNGDEETCTHCEALKLIQEDDL